MLLSILIPTYNRSNFLHNNIEILSRLILDNDLQDNVNIIISNNCSSDETSLVLKEFQDRTEVNVTVFNQNKNIGSVRNVLFLFSKAESDYVMFLGDDDYIEEKYLVAVCKFISKSSSPSVIIPSNLAISEAGEELGYSRDVGLPSKVYPPGFNACLNTSWRGHQMSGLVFLRSPLQENMDEKKVCNMYLFIYFVAYLSLRGSVLHLTEYPVKVSRPSQKAKGWSYGDDGLISEVFDNYFHLDGIGLVQRFLLEIKFLDEQYWRYFMYLKLGTKRFFRSVLLITTGSNTSVLTRFLFPLAVFVIPIKRVVILVARRELGKTLRRSVDI